MTTIRAAAVAMLTLAVLTGQAVAQTRDACYGALCVTSVQTGDVTTLTARNTEAVAPISVTLKLRLTNMDAQGTSQAVLAPGQTLRMITLRPSGTGRWSFGYEYDWMPGDFRARPDPGAVYALPFARAELPVIQGCGGWFSHRGDADQAIDIAMPVGTPVRAARAGRVISTRMDSRVGGRSKRYLDMDNKVLVQHADGSVAAYSHLAFDSARVRPGARVSVGDVLALSGNTGYSGRPHLHFEVFTPRPGGGRISWPVRWDVGGQALTCPRRGTVLRN